MKVAFYISNKNISSVDNQEVEEGNPGIGGSEYSAILISTLLSRYKKLECVLLCDVPANYPKDLNWVQCNDLAGAVEYYKNNDFDYLVVDAKLLEKCIVLRFYDVKFIAWANCFIPEPMLNFYANQSNLVKIVNVGKEQYQLLKNLPVFKKSTYIYNAVPTNFLNDYKQILQPNALREPNVVYIGSLIPSKGFHLLAQAWPKVVKDVPNAKLFVIGSGKLYSRNSRLGKWGIASKKYEDMFMQHLAPEGELMPSVHFLGILGKEKYDILSKCKVGVPNPSGISETFGYTAVEMEIMDCLITTIKCPGYIDTVYDKKNLYDSPDKLANNIKQLLKSDIDIYPEVMKYVSKFSVDTIVSKWEQFLLSLPNNERINFVGNRRFAIIQGFIKYYLNSLTHLVLASLKSIYRLVNFMRDQH